jgi:fused signal recognition particle receptor
MMNSSTENMMMYLVGFIVVLIFSIAIPIAISLLKKKKPIEIAKSIGPDTENKALVQTEAVAVAVAEAPVVTQVTSEKEVSVSDALKKTEENFFGRIKNAFNKNSSEKKKVLDEIEEILYTSDLGPKTVERLLTQVSEDLSKSEMMDLKKIKSALESEMNSILSPVHAAQINSKSVIDLISKAPAGPTVLMVVGVNGAGKTTSIGKITSQLAAANQKVLVAAGDTFRAAAGGQLKVWTDRASNHSGSEGLVEIFWPENTNDPAAVAFDAVTKAKSKNFDYVILDTAGRLHTQSNLMDELKKVKRVMTKVIDSAPHETWIVLDANSGQNALNQAVEFNKALELTGVVLTKMDGTAKGGVALGVVDQLQKPIKLIGIGEKIGDLRVFNQTEYIESILGRG